MYINFEYAQTHQIAFCRDGEFPVSTLCVVCKYLIVNIICIQRDVLIFFLKIVVLIICFIFF